MAVTLVESTGRPDHSSSDNLLIGQHEQNIFNFPGGVQLGSSSVQPGGQFNGTLTLNDSYTQYPMRVYYDNGSLFTNGTGALAPPGLVVSMTVVPSSLDGSFTLQPADYSVNESQSPYWGPFSQTDPLFTLSSTDSTVSFQVTVPASTSPGNYKFLLDFAAYENSTAVILTGAQGVFVNFTVVQSIGPPP
jgi:hypothetical protein